tara:strand:- start:44 stop:271 length:228 start_codon:yes stop_codon:yes gene_type:complete
MREETNMLTANNLEKFTVSPTLGGIVQIAVETRGGTSARILGLSPADARELARRINLAASQAHDHALDVNMLPGL